MPKVLFVGDTPTKNNIAPTVAFVGTRSFVTLMRWVHYINPYYYLLINSDTITDLNTIVLLHDAGGFKVIALGNKASSQLKKINVSHFKLPHPSGRNKKLNDKIFIEVMLNSAKTYLGIS